MPPALLLLLFEWFFLKHAYTEIHELVMFAICYLCCMLTKVQRAPMNVCTPAWLLRCFFFLFRNNKQGGGGGHAFPISTVKMRLFEGKPASGLRKEGISLGWGRKIKTQRNLDQVQVERRGFFSRSVFISLYFINCVAAVLNQFWELTGSRKVSWVGFGMV